MHAAGTRPLQDIYHRLKSYVVPVVSCKKAEMAKGLRSIKLHADLMQEIGSRGMESSTQVMEAGCATMADTWCGSCHIQQGPSSQHPDPHHSLVWMKPGNWAEKSAGEGSTSWEWRTTPAATLNQEVENLCLLYAATNVCICFFSEPSYLDTRLKKKAFSLLKF